MRRKYWLIAAALLLVFLLCGCSSSGGASAFREKIALIEPELLADAGLQDISSEIGHAVFISVCDKTQRASVYTGTGGTLKDAWTAAVAAAESAIKQSKLEPVWVKADAVYFSETLPLTGLNDEILASRQEFFRYGISFDGEFKLALLEAELNGNKIYDYEKGEINLSYLNNYLRKIDRDELTSLPEKVTVFRCLGWLCDEESTVYALYGDGLEYGRRQVELIDRDYAQEIVFNASQFLVNQVKDDGKFIYGYYPRFDNEIDNYNIVRHASTIWSLICRYRMTADEELGRVIESTIEYMLMQIIYESTEVAYLYEAKDDEIKLGGCGMAVVAMTEYMDAFQSDRYTEICRKLGNGILKLLDQGTGKYYHVLNGDLTRKEEYRTVYYDGEATFALCRLYSLTGEQQWLDAAESAVGNFIKADYTQHKDHWVAYSMNEITKHVDKPEYYLFALQNVQKNLDTIYERDTTYHTYFELLMSSFELLERMDSRGIQVDYPEFDLPYFLKTIYKRADRMLDGYFFPEYVMYMEKPDRTLNTFMVRHDGYRVRIDDVQHNIGGFYLYYKHYDKLVEYGLIDYRD